MAKAEPKKVLELCDKFRDVDLVPLGVALDDQEGVFFFVPFEEYSLLVLFVSDGRALVKLVPAATLIRLRDEKNAIAEAKATKKAAAQAAEETKKIAKLAKGKTPPQEMFKPPLVEEGTYGSWDENGIPLTDDQGEELTKNKKKRFLKEWEAQKRLHTEWHAWQKENVDS